MAYKHKQWQLLAAVHCARHDCWESSPTVAMATFRHRWPHWGWSQKCCCPLRSQTPWKSCSRGTIDGFKIEMKDRMTVRKANLAPALFPSLSTDLQMSCLWKEMPKLFSSVLVNSLLFWSDFFKVNIILSTAAILTYFNITNHVKILCF